MTVYFHCGLHKTGTTAIQAACAQNRELLSAHGLIYPPTGVGENGHHNLAWQMSGDRRFDHKGFDFLTAHRICGDDTKDILFSSEDFESLLHRPKQFLFYLEGLRNTGHEIKLIIYTRNQNDYAQSLYAEIIEQGFGGGYAEFVDEIHSTGYFKYRDWVFQFDGNRLAASLAQLATIQVIMRDYDAIAADQSVVTDFFPLLGLAPQIFPETAASRLNQRDSPAAMLGWFYQRRSGHELTVPETTLMARLTANQSFFPGPRYCLTDSPPPASYARMERVFSARTADTITRLIQKPSILNGLSEKWLVRWWNR